MGTLNGRHKTNNAQEETMAEHHAGMSKDDIGQSSGDSGWGSLTSFPAVDDSTMSFISGPSTFAMGATLPAMSLAWGSDSFGHTQSDHYTKPGAWSKHGGSVETFQHDAVGSFPAGWQDAGTVDPDSTAPTPSAEVVRTTDAFGHTTKALAIEPGFADSQGIYRAVDPANTYFLHADVRVDQFSDFDPNPNLADCGCPPGTETALDWPMQVGFVQAQGTTDLSHAPTVAMLTSAETQSWHIIALTNDVVVNIDLGVPTTIGTWYGVDFSLDAAAGVMHGRVTDVAAGTVLADASVSLSDFGPWDPAADGVFDQAAFIDGEITATQTPNLAVIDNLAVRTGSPLNDQYNNWISGGSSDCGCGKFADAALA